MFTMRHLLSSLLVLTTIAAGASATGVRKASSLSSLPLADQLAISASIGKDRSTFFAHPTANGVEMQNSAGTLKAVFTDEGTGLRTTSGNWGLRLISYGDAEQTISAAKVAPSAQANRVEYRRGAFTEWYENGPSGVEQGFTVDRPLQSERSGDLQIVLGLSGDLKAIADQDGHGLSLLDNSQRVRLRYFGLKAFDANHNDLPAVMTVTENRLVMRIDDRNAKYPVTIDPIAQLAELTASDGQPEDGLGFSVAVSGNTVVVGAPEVNIGSNIAAGAAYVFVKPSSGWANETQVAKLTASDGVTSGDLGFSVAIQGDTIVAGAPDNCLPPNPGKVYVFVEPSSGWTDMTQTAELTSTDGICLGG